MIRKGDQVKILNGKKKRFVGIVENIVGDTATITLHHNKELIDEPIENLTIYPTEERKL